MTYLLAAAVEEQTKVLLAPGGHGMVPRGEVGIVVAQIGLGMAVISDSLGGVVLMMAVATTLIAPPRSEDSLCFRKKNRVDQLVRKAETE